MTPYTDSDNAINSQIADLYTSVVEKMKEFRFHDYVISDITTYGIFPRYTEQKLKILFIGREARGLSGHNYMDVLFNAYKESRVGDAHLNQAAFHRRMLKVAYYLNNPNADVEEIPAATEIAKDFGCSGGCSFAFMNLSKFSNESDSWNTKWDLLNESNLDHEFTKRFVEIVSPDLIISMGIRNELKKVFSFKDEGNLGSALLFSITEKDKIIDWIDGYHYSAPNISDLADVLNPITQYMIKKKGA
jgi:hypothetical protein